MSELDDVLAENYRLAQDMGTLVSHLATCEKLLAERDRLMDAIPECPTHGAGCVEHAIEWVGYMKSATREAMRSEIAALRAQLAAPAPAPRTCATCRYFKVIFNVPTCLSLTTPTISFGRVPAGGFGCIHHAPRPPGG